jgi:hypothetical protein
MNTIINTKIGLRSIAMLLTLTLAGLAGTDRHISFSGSLQGQETDTLVGNPPTEILVDGLVTGIATHLGRFTMAYKVTVSLPAGSATGSAQLTAANGDIIFYNIVGQGQPVPDTPGLNRIVEINTITGGTGRFAAAQGSFTVERLVDLSTQPAPTSGSFQGTLTLPGGAD